MIYHRTLMITFTVSEEQEEQGIPEKQYLFLIKVTKILQGN